MSKRDKIAATVQTIRCAIYTRKSTEEGLDQEFNSLDSQRQSAEAFIASQQHEGWVVNPEMYDDGGFSGGNIERPALKRLMDDIEAGKIDCVVVYKVDRLSRSLLDFSQVMGTFDKYGVSFVSVTQQFNTTHSMGRLTLNILLSFAQFEREIIGERIRDKIAGQRRRGQWCGGYPVLGYDVDRNERTPKLVVNADEATKVRRIYLMYLELRSLTAVSDALAERGWNNKLWMTKKGNAKGGRPFDKCSLHALLTNTIYIGKIKHKEQTFNGLHEAIVDEEIYERVQSQLRANNLNRGNRLPSKYGGLLKGLIRCPHCNVAMVHTGKKKKTVMYRYYKCVRAIKRGSRACEHPSLPAGEIEEAVVDQVRAIAGDTGLRDEIIRQADEASLRRKEEFETQRMQLTRQLSRDHAEVRNLVLVEQANSSTTARIADLQQRIETAERSLATVNRQLAEVEKDDLTADFITEAFADFDRVWDALNIREKAQLLGLLVAKVEFDQAESTIEISFHSSGIASLEALQQEEVTA
ncbi:DNA-invertase hin [Rubripirellula obstinata]|uniref:DNA-invertase hin n=1 Tax=Rubripirellula obstinata TaxID=406547 RepID=A0A5B1CB50_9BACT|nr:recombinase family protein [Rubripirellula obstinata]KAA1258317.1 DNA-invertase hin [Rubripirellula obstinata]